MVCRQALAFLPKPGLALLEGLVTPSSTRCLLVPLVAKVSTSGDGILVGTVLFINLVCGCQAHMQVVAEVVERRPKVASVSDQLGTAHGCRQ